MAARIPQPKRFRAPGYTAGEMRKIATALRDSVKARILRAQDLGDGPAAPLKQPEGRVVQINGKRGYMRGYPFQKVKRGRKPQRDWYYTGALMEAMQVLSARRNRAVIGFTDPLSNLKAAVNNRRWRQFGVSPRDRVAMNAAAAVFGGPVGVGPAEGSESRAA